MRAGYVTVRVVDATGRQLDSDVVLAHLYLTGSPLYNVVSELLRAGHIGELFALWSKGFKVRYEGGVWKVEHYQYEVKGTLYPQDDGGFALEVIVPDIDVSAERALLAAWRALRALGEVSEELGKLKERVAQLEDELERQREELRGIREEHARGSEDEEE